NYALWNSGQPRHFDSITSIRATRFHFTQENYLVSSLFHRHVQIAHAFERFFQLRQLVIMGREKSLRTNALMNLLDDSPRERKAVVSRCSSANFIQNNEAVFCCGV